MLETSTREGVEFGGVGGGAGWNSVGGAEASLSCQLLPLCPALFFSSVVSVLSIFDNGVDSG